MGRQAEDCSAWPMHSPAILKLLQLRLQTTVDVAVPEGVTYSLGVKAPFAAAARRRTRGRRPHESIHMRAGGGPQLCLSKASAHPHPPDCNPRLSRMEATRA